MKIPKTLYIRVIHPMIFKMLGIDLYSKISEIDKSFYLPYSEIINNQNVKLIKLVKEACANTKYYGGYLNKEIGEPYQKTTIGSLPVLDKSPLSKYPDDFVNRNYSTCGPLKKTSGTTGIPVKVNQDKGCYSYQLASRYSVFKWHGINIGDREARFWSQPTTSKKSTLILDMLRNRANFNFINKADKELKAEADKLLRYKPDYFYGYSSLLLNAALIWKKFMFELPKLKAVVCTAEQLSEIQRDLITDVFKCPVVIEYGCSECDIIAFECEMKKLHVLTNRVLVEEDENNSGEILVTDLDNFYMPLIKYRLGDLIELDSDKCECRRTTPTIKKIIGRTNNRIIKLPNGRAALANVFSQMVNNINEKYGNQIYQFNVMQHELDHFTIYLAMADCQNDMREVVSNHLKNELGNDVNIDVIIKDRIEIGSKNGYFHGK